MFGLYNSAFLSSELMSTINAEILHRDLTHFLDRALMGMASSNYGREDPNGSKQTEEVVATNGYLQFFMMVPYSPKYKDIINAVRVLVEDHWFSRLLLASDRKYEDRTFDSVSRHIKDAAVFIAEVSEGNPNVMFELGAVFGQRRQRPIIQLASAAMQGTAERVQLPADISSMIYVDYSSLVGDNLVNFLNEEFRKDQKIDGLVSQQNRGFFVSPRRLQKIGKNLLPEHAYNELSRRFPTEAQWIETDPEIVARFLPEGSSDIAQVLVNRIRSAFVESR